jgi:hypothetical protein
VSVGFAANATAEAAVSHAPIRTPIAIDFMM